MLLGMPFAQSVTGPIQRSPSALRLALADSRQQKQQAIARQVA